MCADTTGKSRGARYKDRMRFTRGMGKFRGDSTVKRVVWGTELKAFLKSM